jgi:hypothetical protein
VTLDQSRGARTVTLLFTDIEGSTVLLRLLGPRWGEALTAHRELVRRRSAWLHGSEGRCTRWPSTALPPWTGTYGGRSTGRCPGLRTPIWWATRVADGVGDRVGDRVADRAADRVRAGVDLDNEMTRYWYRFGSTVVSRHWQERALAALQALPDGGGDVDGPATVNLLHGLAISMLQHADTEASLDVVQRSLGMAERLGRQDLQARALVDLGIGHVQLCRPTEAVELFGRAAALAREGRDERLVALAEANTALAYFDMRRFAEAVELGWRSLATRTGLGDRWAACVDRINLLGALLPPGGAGRAAYPRGRAAARLVPRTGSRRARRRGVRRGAARRGDVVSAGRPT